MTKEEARKRLLDWIQYATNPEGVPFMDEPCSDEEILLAMRIGADALSKPSLPSNLDEAAEESIPEEEGFLEIDIYGGSIAVYSREQMLAMFKAGAELMTRQFQRIEGELVDWHSTSDGKDYCCGVKTQDAFEVPEGFYIKRK